MDAGETALKKISAIALAALFILLAGAMVFYKERILFSDASFILFSIVNFDKLSIQEHRYGSFITQVVPYIGQKLHLPLKAILISYSVSFNLFYLLVATFLYRCRQYALAILMALYYFLFISDAYFWINDEIHQAIAWMFLFFGVIIYLGNKKAPAWVLLAPFLLLAALSIFTHFVVIIPLVFLWLYLIIEKKNWPFSGKVSLLFSGLLLVIVFIKYLLAGSSQYEGAHLYGVTHFSLKDIIDSFTTPVVSMFLYRCVTNYWIGILVFIAGITCLFINKQRILAALVLCSCLCYFIIMGLSYADLDKNVLLFHIESEWACIGVIVATPFVFACLPKLKTPAAAGVIGIIFLVRLFYIGAAIPTFSWRIHFQERVLEQMKKKNIPKLAIIDDFPDMGPKYLLGWAAGYESLFTSSMNGDKPNCTFFFVNKNDKEKREMILNPKGFYNVWGMLPYNAMNSTYFTIDTTRPYQTMTYDELFN